VDPISTISPSSRLEGLPPRAPQEAGEAPSRLAPDRVTLSGEARARLAGGDLTRDQQQEVQQLRQRDAQVRQHEAAHQAAGGQLTGPASFSYQTGPDGKSYAVGGEVQVSAHAGRTPDETIAIARQVRAAALAPGDPSPADLSAASSAAQMEAQAQQQKQAQQADSASQDGAGRSAKAGALPVMGADRPAAAQGAGAPQAGATRPAQPAPAQASSAPTGALATAHGATALLGRTPGTPRQAAAAAVSAASAGLAGPSVGAHSTAARSTSVAGGVAFSLEQLVVRPRATA